MISALPTSLPENARREPYLPAVHEDDLVLEVMNDMLPLVDRERANWREMEQVAVLVIDRVLNAPVTR